ncbi:LLM class F420-dependent oxidoreductase [Nonomuraea endophytica]|uniref:Putative F420-dependent oxidoreductase n=1 Tax=Nonomuraea endophytica TaxID=714136 RepID=A0A7W7ZXK2_9ACTN|nr:LLM class F420-dependent oxidoreductase [Nonomuraea endophytica]MBB5075304.1 putative F420-dependent oxidoreductase [Nonomuraea endophytica]
MKFGISYSTPYYGVDPQKIVAFAQLAEECGFESIYLPEHIVLYPGAKVGTFEIPPALPYLDPLDCLSFIAAATERILLGTGVLLLPYHHPVILAKRLATVDVLSGGRMRLLTVGLGALPGEAEAIGVDFTTRGRRADEAIDVLRLLWAGGEEGVSHSGEFFSFTDLVSFPKPHQTTRLPIHVGGSSRPAARRAGRLGDGYFPGGRPDPAQWDLVRATAAESGRNPDTLDYTRTATIDMSPEHLADLTREGVTRVVVNTPATSLEQQRKDLTDFSHRFGL